MHSFTVRITAEYVVSAETPKKALLIALDRSDTRDQLSTQVDCDE